MNKLHSFKLVALLSIVAGLQAYGDDCGPLERGRWYVMPKIGVAPGIFANRGHEQAIFPANAVPADCVIQTSDAGLECRAKSTTPENVLVEGQCKAPKFGDLFSNGVLHVAGEIGHNTCDNSQWFIEAFYNRASGSNVCLDGNYVRAPEGCVADCNKDCNTNNCTTGDVLNTLARTDCYDNYSAYGAYVGHRHYFSRVWCDRVSFFTGMKFGIQHRKEVSVNSNIGAYTADLNGETLNFAERDVCRVAFCKSNAVSGGLQLGADYCINDCLSFLIGAEIQVTSPFKGNNNARLALAVPTDNGTPVPTAQYVIPQPTNLLRCGTGTFVQFPVWAALRWEFDWCNPCNPCA